MIYPYLLYNISISIYISIYIIMMSNIAIEFVDLYPLKTDHFSGCHDHFEPRRERRRL